MAIKKSTRKQKSQSDGPPDIRAPLEPTAEALQESLAALRSVLAKVEPPAAPGPSDLVDAMLHITFAEGVPCGVGQEALRRLRNEFVDRNEFRLTEAFEIEALLADLGIPDLFQRSARARDAIAEIYNDQNDISLEFLREASVSDRQMFFQRVPVLTPAVAHFVVTMLTFEEVCFSDRSTMRLQQRIGLEPKEGAVTGFLLELRELLRPYGHLPLRVGPDATDGKPILDPPLCAASLVVRLAPPAKGR